jgi:hypothetical protein
MREAADLHSSARALCAEAEQILLHRKRR